MSRPVGIPESDLERWRSEGEEHLKTNSIPPLMNREQYLESFVAGQWLGERLLARGLSNSEMEAQCFVQGQIHASQVLQGIQDPWQACDRVLDALDAGTPLQPGNELASQLLQEATGPDGRGASSEFRNNLKILLRSILSTAVKE